MATLWVFTRQADLGLPEEYQRLELETDDDYEGNNYTFIKPLETDDESRAYLLGEYYEIRDIHQFPGENDLGDREYFYPSTFLSYLYLFPDQSNLLFCIGSNCDSIRHVLSRHTNHTDFHCLPIDLDRLEQGFRRGLIEISGHRYTSEQGTIRSIVRKVDPESFNPDEASYASGAGINKEYLEVLMNFGGINKRFKVYPEGRITASGRPESGSTGIETLRTVYRRIQEVIALARQQ